MERIKDMEVANDFKKNGKMPIAGLFEARKVTFGDSRFVVMCPRAAVIKLISKYPSAGRA
ncbi:MAG: hypothetical protein V3S46_01065 [Nitrospinota bacterium]